MHASTMYVRGARDSSCLRLLCVAEFDIYQLHCKEPLPKFVDGPAKPGRVIITKSTQPEVPDLSCLRERLEAGKRCNFCCGEKSIYLESYLTYLALGILQNEAWGHLSSTLLASWYESLHAQQGCPGWIQETSISRKAFFLLGGMKG